MALPVLPIRCHMEMKDSDWSSRGVAFCVSSSSEAILDLENFEPSHLVLSWTFWNFSETCNFSWT